MYVSFEHPDSKIPLAKQVKGLPGDHIVIVGDQLFLNDEHLGKILEKSRSGHAMTPIEEGRIPEGFLFLQASHKESFDSRYAEFGLIPVSSIKERLWPIF